MKRWERRKHREFVRDGFIEGRIEEGLPVDEFLQPLTRRRTRKPSQTKQQGPKTDGSGRYRLARIPKARLPEELASELQAKKRKPKRRHRVRKARPRSSNMQFPPVEVTPRDLRPDVMPEQPLYGHDATYEFILPRHPPPGKETWPGRCHKCGTKQRARRTRIRAGPK